MSEFWPSEIKKDEFESPKEILTRVGKEICDSVSRLDFNIIEPELDDLSLVSLILENNQSKKKVTVLEIAHAKDLIYPCRVRDAFGITLPKPLQRKHVIPARRNPIYQFQEEIASVLGETPAKEVENQGICSTPNELKSRIRDLLASDSVKGAMINLIANGKACESEGA